MFSFIYAIGTSFVFICDGTPRLEVGFRFDAVIRLWHKSGHPCSHLKTRGASNYAILRFMVGRW